MHSKALQIAEEIANRYNDKENIEQKARQLIGMLPSLTADEIDEVVERLEPLARDEALWKRQIAGQVVEDALTRRPIPFNPLSIGIKHLYEQLAVLNFTGIEFFSSIVQIAVIVPLLALFVIIWPYGLIPVAAGAIWKVILLSRAKIKFKTRDVMEKMPLTLAIGIYLLIWFPLALLCLPFVIIGWIGTLISEDS